MWPEPPVWEDIAGPMIDYPAAGDDGELLLPLAADLASVTEVESALAVEVARLPDPDAQWRPAEAQVPEDRIDAEATVQFGGPLAALGGASGPVPSESAGNVPWSAEVDDPPYPEGPFEELEVREPALGSIWSNDRRADPSDLGGSGAVPAPPIYANTDRNPRSLRWRRFDVRPGNAAVIGLISVVSLVLLGMFLSVRARNNDVPTDASQTRPAANDITVTGPLNTTPQTTAITTTTTAPPVINLSELAQTTETTTAAATTGSASATTTPTTRSAAPTSSAPATTTPTTQATVTTEAPPATTEVTSPPVSDTTPTTSRPTPTFTIPVITIPASPFPTIDRSRLGGFINRDD